MHINEQHYKYFEMRFRGCTNIEIADAIGVSTQTISNWNNTNKELQVEYIKYCNKKMNKHVPSMLDKLVKLTKSHNEQVALSAIKDYLDRVDLKATTKIEQTQNVTVSIDSIKEKLLKLREQNNNNIDNKSVDNVDNIVDKQKKEYKYDENGVYNKYKFFDYSSYD